MTDKLPAIIAAISLLAPWVVFTLKPNDAARWRLFLLFVATVVFIYAVILFSVHLENTEIERVLNGYDLNHDGMFTDTEMTAGFEQAMEAYTNDTGRSFAPFTGGIFSFLYVLFVYVVARVLFWVKKYARGKRT